jgi:alpha-glucosidase (family GH31 glycosyl hydrolase)
MFFEDPTNEAFLATDDQWLFGDHLLVAPALEENMAARDVLLPAGEWYDFWTDERLAGGQTVHRETPWRRVPLFVRAGTTLPVTEVQQFVGEKPNAALTLELFPGSGVSWLYEDDGKTLAYRSGEFRLTRFQMTETADGIVLERFGQGDFTPGYTTMQVIIRGASITSASLDEASLNVLNNQVRIDPCNWRRLRIKIR